jgi:hypothetical protein
VTTTPPTWLDDDMRRQIASIFIQHGVSAPVYLAKEVDPTEANFVVGPVAELPQGSLTRDLVKLLNRKVSATTWGDTWAEVGLTRLDVEG